MAEPNPHHIHTLRIQNFKSIKDIELKPRRINLFVGKPNTGKTNVLQALGVASLSSPLDKNQRLADYVSYTYPTDLLHYGDITHQGLIEANRLKISIGKPFMNEYMYITFGKNSFSILENAVQLNPNFFDYSVQKENVHLAWPKNLDDDDERILVIMFYEYQSKIEARYAGSFLNPPFGNNIFEVIQSNPKVGNLAGQLFKNYSLDLVIDQKNKNMFVQKDTSMLKYFIDYSLTPDTLRRFIFHQAAILSNENRVIVFEEPEAHMHPPYIARLAQSMIDSESNQFFLSTHSPFMVTTILEDAPREDVAIHKFYWEDYQTKVHTLSDHEIDLIHDWGYDIFFNDAAFRPDEGEQVAE